MWQSIPQDWQKMPEIYQGFSNIGGYFPLKNIISAWRDSAISGKGIEPLEMGQNQKIFLNLQHFQRQLFLKLEV